MERARLRLEWSDIDLSTGVIQVVNKEGHATKSRKSRVTSTTPEGCMLLSQIRFASPESASVWTPVKGFSVREVRRHFDKIVKASGIRHCSLHDLRRTHATLMARSVPAAVLQQRLGHSSITTTMKYYVGSLADTGVDFVNAAFAPIKTFLK